MLRSFTTSASRCCVWWNFIWCFHRALSGYVSWDPTVLGSLLLCFSPDDRDLSVAQISMCSPMLDLEEAIGRETSCSFFSPSCPFPALTLLVSSPLVHNANIALPGYLGSLASLAHLLGPQPAPGQSGLSHSFHPALPVSNLKSKIYDLTLLCACLSFQFSLLAIILCMGSPKCPWSLCMKSW